jgi:hypothetical protein
LRGGIIKGQREPRINKYTDLFATHGKQDRAARLPGAVNVALESGSYNTRISSLVDIFDTTAAAVVTK